MAFTLCRPSPTHTLGIFHKVPFTYQVLIWSVSFSYLASSSTKNKPAGKQRREGMLGVGWASPRCSAEQHHRSSSRSFPYLRSRLWKFPTLLFPTGRLLPTPQVSLCFSSDRGEERDIASQLSVDPRRGLGSRAAVRREVSNLRV